MVNILGIRSLFCIFYYVTKEESFSDLFGIFDYLFMMTFLNILKLNF